MDSNFSKRLVISDANSFFSMERVSMNFASAMPEFFLAAIKLQTIKVIKCNMNLFVKCGGFR